MIVTTFYSFKGGLGRSLLLAWTAREFANRGQRVVALDLDLEAPGLPFKLGFSPDSDIGPGLLGLLARFLAGEPPPERLSDFLRSTPGEENLWLLPAGSFVNPEYWQQLAALHWDELFLAPDSGGPRFFLWLREALEREFQADHLLVDARTGVTEMSGVALSLLADQIVALLGTSLEGIFGLRAVLRSVMAAPRPPGRTIPRIGLVLSRIAPTLQVSELQRLRRSIHDEICAEAKQLSATVSTDLPIVVRSETRLHQDERLALGDDNLRVHSDYQVVANWILGEDVPVEIPETIDGDSDSIAALMTSVAIQKELARRDPEHYLPELAESLTSLSRDLQDRGRWESAVRVAREAMEIVSRPEADGSPLRLADRARLLFTLAGIFDRSRNLTEAVHALETARNLQESLVARSPSDSTTAHTLAAILGRLGDLMRALGQGELARDYFQNSLDIRQRLARQEPDRADFQRDLYVSHERLGDAWRALGHREVARDQFQKGLEIAQRLARQEPDRTDYQRDLTVFLNKLGVLLRALGQDELALDYFRRSLETRQRLAERDPDRADLQRDLSVSHERLGDLMLDLEQPEIARDHYQARLEITQRLARQEPDRADFQRDLSVSYERLGDLMRTLGQRDLARDYFQKRLEIAELLARQDPARVNYLRDVCAALERVAGISEGDKATEPLKRAVALRRELRTRIPENAIVQRELAITLWQWGQHAQDDAAIAEAAHLLIDLQDRNALEASYTDLANQLRARLGS